MNVYLYQNNTEKILKNIYIGEYGWKPGSNTIAYYPLTSQTTVNDMSGNNRNLTNGGSVVFGTYAGVDCAYFPSSNTRKLYGSLPLSGTQNFTFNVWINRQGNSTSGYSNAQIIVLGNTGTNYAQFGMGVSDNAASSNSNKYVAWTRGTDKYSSNTNTTNTWNMVTVTHQSGTVKMYVNSTLVINDTISFNVANTNFTVGSIYSPESGYYWNFYGYMSELICESSIWDLDYITEYYNQTKSNYGL